MSFSLSQEAGRQQHSKCRLVDRVGQSHLQSGIDGHGPLNGLDRICIARPTPFSKEIISIRVKPIREIIKIANENDCVKQPPSHSVGYVPIEHVFSPLVGFFRSVKNKSEPAWTFDKAFKCYQSTSY